MTTKARSAEFLRGWRHFWSVFAQSWLFVLGFIAASTLSTVLYGLAKAIIRELWR